MDKKELLKRMDLTMEKKELLRRLDLTGAYSIGNTDSIISSLEEKIILVMNNKETEYLEYLYEILECVRETQNKIRKMRNKIEFDYTKLKMFGEKEKVEE